MSDPFSHLSEAELLAMADGELARDTGTAAADHVAACEGCRARAEELQLTLESYSSHLQQMKMRAPAPPEPWANLRDRMRDLRAPAPVPIRRSRVAFWVPAAAAAAVLAAVIGYQVNRGETVVSAAELLERASRVPQAQGSPKRAIRIKTRTALYVREAYGRGNNPRLQKIAALFEQSGFDWNEPLSARSFAQWRNSLRTKDDRVTIQTGAGGRMYHIRTQTPEGSLAEASITLRGSDLQPLREFFQFRNDESVEIEEGDPEALQTSTEAGDAPPPVKGELNKSTASITIGPSEELQVAAILHRLKADLGEPIDTIRSEDGTSLLVRGLGLSAERQSELKGAFADLLNVKLEFASPDSAEARVVRQPARVAFGRDREIEVWMSGRLGTAKAAQEVAEESLDYSEMALAHAHALRALARRFPVDTQWTERESALLDELARDHARTLHDLAAKLRSRLQPLTGSIEVQTASDGRPWRQVAPELLAATLRLDQLLNRTLAASTTESPEQLFARIGGGLADASSKIASVQAAREDGR